MNNKNILDASEGRNAESVLPVVGHGSAPVVLGNSGQATKDGTSTRAIYIKHLSLADWEILSDVKRVYSHESIADTVRWCIRKASGRI